jgi:predicted  nucleic acid-binding Zn ribbon protein
MYVGHLAFAKASSSERASASDAIDMLLSTLRMNGQICGREFPIAVTPGTYVATVLMPEMCSLDDSHSNRYVRSALEQLTAAGLAAPERTIAEDIDSIGSCACERSTSFILYTTYVSLEPPLRCGSCFLAVPLYRIPPTRGDEYNNVINWHSDYQSCDRLQMNCATLERAAMRQLSRHDSSLSQAGLEICRSLFELTRIPTYYYLCSFGAKVRLRPDKRLCPSCANPWQLLEPWHSFASKCDECRLVSSII